MNPLYTLLTVWVCLSVFACDSQTQGQTIVEDSGVTLDSTTADTQAEVADLAADNLDASEEIVEPSLEFCQVGITDPVTGGVFECVLEPRTMLGCEDLARCVCEAWEAFSPGPVDIETCIFSMVVPRGAITLADFCTLSGNPGATSLLELGDQVWDASPMAGDLTLSTECGAIAAFTLWGEAPAMQWEPSKIGESLPGLGTALYDYPFEGMVLADLSEVETFEFTTRQLELTSEGASALQSRVEALGDGLLGRFFVFHDTLRPLLQGVFVSNVMSSTRDSLVILVENLSGSSYSQVPIREGYPQLDLPAETYELGMFAALFASQGKLLDAACISSCGCPAGRACVDGRCAARMTCESDSDCCLGTCRSGACQ